MATTAIVIGGGISGASTAFFLTEHGVQVTLLERTFPAGGPTGSSSAITHAFYMEPELSLLAKRGVEILRGMDEIASGPSDYRAVGMMWAVGESAVPEWSAAAERIAAEGNRVESLTPDQLAREVPDWVMDNLSLAIFEPDGGYADPATSTNSLVNGARSRGMTLRNNTTVDKLVVNNGRVTGVVTREGDTLEADVVVVAAGPWSRSLLATAGLDVPLTVERHPMAVLSTPKRSRVVMPWSWSDDTLLNYARPEGEDLVLLGEWAGGGISHRNETVARGAAVDDEMGFARAVDLEESAPIISTFEPRMPKIGEESIRPGYADLYDMSPDDMPLIGPAPELDGLYVIAGTSGHGFKTGPAVGEAVASLITTGEAPLLAPFALQRFAAIAE